jgi:hypothetical protein
MMEEIFTVTFYLNGKKYPITVHLDEAKKKKLTGTLRELSEQYEEDKIIPLFRKK